MLLSLLSLLLSATVLVFFFVYVCLFVALFVCRLAGEPHYGRMSGGGTLSHRESFNATS